MSDTWIIVGAGGHGRVVLDALLVRGVNPNDIYVVDANAKGNLDGIRIRKPNVTKTLNTSRFIVAIGDNAVRRRIHIGLCDEGHYPCSIVHPFAYVSPIATLGHGTVVCAQANVGPGAVVAEGCIINTGANVEHDCVVGPFTHIAPKASLCGGVHVGAMCLVGSGATVLPGASVQDNAIVGAQGLVREKQIVAGRSIVVGVPAAEISRR